ncbi:MAG TPA: hypothetical protein VEK07_11620 [Polyangiaceae bacterium]|nr:hypothetical protein [Polyangiaceae bacterium]
MMWHLSKWTVLGLAALMTGVGLGCSGASGRSTDPAGATSSGVADGSASSGEGGGASASTASSGDAGTVGGIVGGIVGVGTTVAGCTIFPADNPWNVEIDGPNVQVVHAYDSQIPQGGPVHPDFGGYTSNVGGIPFNVVDAGQPDLDTEFTLYASESDPGPDGWIGPNPVTSGSATGETAWPFFVPMEIEGNPAAGGTPGSLPGDQHALVLQQGAGGCTAYEAWNCVVVSAPPFQCANGAVFDLTSNALRPAGWTSADAAGLAILPGLVKLSEVVTSGVVTHAIRMTFATTQQGYIPPATHAAGSQPLGSAYPPMGLRLRMKATVSTTKYTAASQVIMAAMKKYGLIVADNGSDWYFQGDSNDGWNATAPDGQDTLIDEIVGDFRSLSGSDFEVVYTSDPVATGL